MSAVDCIGRSRHAGQSRCAGAQGRVLDDLGRRPRNGPGLIASAQPGVFLS
jgi:hypothetical protein